MLGDVDHPVGGQLPPKSKFPPNRRLRAARKDLGMTQRQLAAAADLGPEGHTAISKIETGKQDSKFSTISKLAGPLHKQPADIMPLGTAPIPEAGRPRLDTDLLDAYFDLIEEVYPDISGPQKTAMGVFIAELVARPDDPEAFKNVIRLFRPRG